MRFFNGWSLNTEKWLLLLLLGIFPLMRGLAQVEPLDLSKIKGRYTNEFVQIAVCRDPTGTLSIDSIIQPHQQKAFVSLDQVNTNTEQRQWYWFKIGLKNKQLDDRWMLEVMSLHTPVVEVFFVTQDGRIIPKKAGHSLSFYQKQDYKVKNIAFEIPFGRSDEVAMYLHLPLQNPRRFLFNIQPAKSFVEYTVNEYLMLGLYYGVLLIIAIYNLALYITTRESIHLLYVPYILSCILTSLTEDGLGFAYLWPAVPSFNQSINYFVAPLFFLITFVAYSRKFLDLRKRSRRLDNFLLLVTLLYILYFLLSKFSGLSLWPRFSFYVIPFICLYLISLLVLLQGFKAARFYVMAYSVVCLSLLIGILRTYGWVTPSVWTVYSFNLGLVIEVCVMSYAIGDKFRIIKEQQEETQQELIGQLERNHDLQLKVNRELEDKVQERTMALNEANAALAKMSEELKEMNVKLDYDNWHLKKKIVEEKRESVLSKVVSFEEFMQRFPDDLTCQRYIETIKWDKGYTCKKCGGNRFHPIVNSLSRKCTKCDAVESITAYTLYHGLRFPLVKAFYITHVVMNDLNHLRIEDLVEVLDLSKNTCWKFRKKVEERVAVLKKQKKDVHSWETLIIEKESQA